MRRDGMSLTILSIGIYITLLKRSFVYYPCYLWHDICATVR